MDSMELEPAPDASEKLNDVVEERLRDMIELCHLLYEVIPELRDHIVDRMLEIEAVFLAGSTQRLTMPISEPASGPNNGEDREETIRSLMGKLGVGYESFTCEGMLVAYIRHAPENHG